MTARRLSQLLALALAVLSWWVMVSRAGVIDAEFAIEIYAAFAVVVALVFGLTFLGLRLAIGSSAFYWSMKSSDQVRPIAWMILSALGVMLVADMALHWLNRGSSATSTITYLLAGTLVPAAFVKAKLVAWPSRISYPGWLKLVLIGGLAVGLAAAWTFGAYSTSPDKADIPPVSKLIVITGDVILGATFEEVVFRVLLLTALLERTGSRFQAVLLSSAAFALAHVPGALLIPILDGDWVVLQQVAFEYAPVFLMQTLAGLLLGVLWLRTGSITLIAATHAILNIANALAYHPLGFG